MSVRARTIRTASTVLYRSGLWRPLIAVADYLHGRAGFPILAFHRVNDDHDPFFPSLPTTVFAARMRHIARHYVVLSVEELAERLRQRSVPPNALALTFDDGYRDSLTHAAPILARHALPATIFLVTGYMGSPEMLWHDLLAFAFKTSRRDRVELATGQSLPLRSVAQRLEALKVTLHHMKGIPDDQRQRNIDRLLKQLDPATPDRQKRLMLTWDEVNALRGLGVSLGAHTVRHPILSRVEPESAWAEIRGSKVAIERAVGATVRAFAYPNGGPDDYTSTTVQLVRRAGFTCAVTTRRGLNTSATPLLELRRGGPWEQHLPTYAMKLAYYQLAGV